MIATHVIISYSTSLLIPAISMSRQTTGNSPAQNSSNLQQQMRSDQLLGLQAQIEQCQHERRNLIQSRNYAIIAAILAGLAIFYLLFLKPPVDNTDQQQAIIARQLAAQKKQSIDQNCVRNSLIQKTAADNQSVKKNVNETISKIKHKLEPGQISGASGDQSKPGISSVLDDLAPPVSYPKVRWREKQAISRLVHLWAVAWELKDLPTYFAYYASNFDTQNSEQNFSAWKASRSYHIEKPDSIKVNIRDLKLKGLTDNTATVSFNQIYITPGYSDISHKLFELVWQDNQWLIFRESSFTTDVNFK